MKKQWVIEIQEDPWGGLHIELPPEVIEHLDLKEGDEVSWKDRGDGSFELTKLYDDEDVGC